MKIKEDWTFDLLESFDQKIGKLANEFKLSTYPNQIEIINSEQMMDNYSSVGMPLGYPHWSFGKQYLQIEKNYKHGLMGLAYELVINSNPCITYLMEENSLPMQVLVIAHACYGHNSFFKNNYLFKTWTSADSIIDYLVFAKSYIAKCEQKYGLEEVESMLDAAHALMNYGVDRYKHPKKISLKEEKSRQASREEYLQSQINELWRTIPKSQQPPKETTKKFPPEPEENILYFIEKNAPLLEPWQREIIRIVRKIAQYFYPQRQTKVMNEGWATFWHYQLLNTLYDKKELEDAFMVEFLHHHTNVTTQLPFDHKAYTGINPYALGFGIFQEIKRICQAPSEEDKVWHKDIAGADWIETLHFAMENFKDESFIAQFLSPNLIRDFKLFCLLDDENKNTLEITQIHNDSGYQKIRETLSQSYNLSYMEPNIQIYEINTRSDRSMRLRYYMQDNRPLSTDRCEVLKHLYKLWGFPIILEYVNESGEVRETYQCPPQRSVKPPEEERENKSVK